MIDMTSNMVWPAIAIVLSALAFGGWLRKRGELRRARSWPLAIAQVESSEIRLEGGGTDQMRYLADVVYAYDLQGEAHSGRVRHSFMLQGRARRWTDRFQVGRSVTIRYDPANVGHSVMFEDEQVEAAAR
jgi:Protein of unknown function (DUF3592)